MDWQTELGKAFGPTAAVVIFSLGSSVVYLVRRLNASEEAHNRTRDLHAAALQTINEKVTAAFLASGTNVAQFTELLRQVMEILRKGSQ